MLKIYKMTEIRTVINNSNRLIDRKRKRKIQTKKEKNDVLTFKQALILLLK